MKTNLLPKKLMKAKYILMLFSIVFSTLANAQVDEKSIFRNGDLEISFVTNFTRVWYDAGSGANVNGAFFRPVLKDMTDFYSLGDLALNSHSATEEVMAVVRDKSIAGDILVEPTDYKLVWTDAGSGANQDGSIWRPIPPKGYVAMGLVAQNGYAKPSKSIMRCIKEEYVVNGSVSEKVIWNDQGSGADSDFSSWGIVAPMVSSGAGQMYLSANTFVGHASHAKPSVSDPNLYVLILPINEELSADTITPQLPELTSLNEPSLYSNFGTVSTTYLPWFSVNDDQLDMLQRIVKSPTYKMVRETRYRRINFLHNQGATTSVMNWSATYGTSKSKSEAYSKETGIEMTVGWQSPLQIMSASISLSLKFTHTTETTNQWSQESSISVEVPVLPNSAAAAYLLESTYKLYRLDGSLVGTELDHRPSGSFYVTTYTQPTSGITKTEIPSLNVYPNPSSLGDKIHIDFPTSNIYQIDIQDLTGKTIYSLSNTQNFVEIYNKELQKGMYIMNVYNEHEKHVKKIIVQ